MVSIVWVSARGEKLFYGFSLGVSVVPKHSRSMDCICSQSSICLGQVVQSQFVLQHSAYQQFVIPSNTALVIFSTGKIACACI